MSIKNSLILLFLAFLTAPLFGCGFGPMYASGAGSMGFSAPQGLDTVEIALIPDQSGVYLRNILIDNFYQDGYPSSPTHLLTVTDIDALVSDFDITVDSEATRKQIKITGVVHLTDRATGQVVMSRELKAFTSYNVLGSQFTTRVSENDAREAALADLARQIETQVVLYFKR